METCESVRSLLSGYLDGELSEEQAGPMRAHLLDCRSCRDSVQEGKVIGRWFSMARPQRVEIPHGFAARTARRAFAGDGGHTSAAGSAAALGWDPAGQAAGGDWRAPRSIVPFALKLSTLAAGLLFVFSLMIQQESLPQGSGMEAQERNFWESEEFLSEWEARELEEHSPEATPASSLDPEELDPTHAPDSMGETE